jgi:LmbE family N-acetylglucosaminyl deacetylase
MSAWLRALAAAGLLVAASAGAPAASPPAVPELPPPTAADRVLVIAPHPDDETLCCAGFLQRAVQAGAAVAVVWVTAGDSFEFDAVITEHTLLPRAAGMKQLGVRRIAEGRDAAASLGVPRANQYLLGYPDRALGALLSGSSERPLRSQYTGVSAVPYAEALSPGSSYQGANLRRDLASVLGSFAPTIVLAPAPQDQHPDHRASGVLIAALLPGMVPQVRLYYWIVHAGRRWPGPHGLHPMLPLRPPPRLASLGWQRLGLSAAERAGKLQALRRHRTQMAVMSGYLNAFVRADELFLPSP